MYNYIIIRLKNIYWHGTTHVKTDFMINICSIIIHATSYVNFCNLFSMWSLEIFRSSKTISVSYVMCRPSQAALNSAHSVPLGDHLFCIEICVFLCACVLS